jgi:hypothetical protein
MTLPHRHRAPSFALCLVGLLILTLIVTAASGAAPPAGADAADVAHVPLSPSLREMDQWGEHARTAKIMLVLLQVAAILAAASCSGGWRSGGAGEGAGCCR